MKKKILALLLVVTNVIFCSACAGKETNQISSSIQKEADTVNGESSPGTKAEETNTPETDDEKYEYPSKDAEEVVWKSPLGYSMTYDPTIFTLDDTSETDVFTYNTAESLDAPVYISVQPYPDMDAQTLAEGLALQSGIDGIEASDAIFGADGIETKYVYIEKKVNEIKQLQIFYAIPLEKGSLLMELGAYIGVPTSIDSKIENMLGTFTLTTK